MSVLDTGIVTCIDNWKQNIHPQNDAFDSSENTKQQFDENTKSYKNLKVYNNNMFDVKLENKGYDLFFYDGPYDLTQQQKQLNTTVNIQMMMLCFYLMMLIGKEWLLVQNKE